PSMVVRRKNVVHVGAFKPSCTASLRLADAFGNVRRECRAKRQPDSFLQLVLRAARQASSPLLPFPTLRSAVFSYRIPVVRQSRSADGRRLRGRSRSPLPWPTNERGVHPSNPRTFAVHLACKCLVVRYKQESVALCIRRSHPPPRIPSLHQALEP